MGFLHGLKQLTGRYWILGRWFERTRTKSDISENHDGLNPTSFYRAIQKTVLVETRSRSTKAKTFAEKNLKSLRVSHAAMVLVNCQCSNTFSSYTFQRLGCRICHELPSTINIPKYLIEAFKDEGSRTSIQICATSYNNTWRRSSKPLIDTSAYAPSFE